MTVIPIRFPDPEYAEPFRAYSNYVEDLAGVVGGLYGWYDSLVTGLLEAVEQHPPARTVTRRKLTSAQRAALDGAMRKVWGNLRRVSREIEDITGFDEESNAWIPAQAYYAVYHAIVALAIASGQPVPRDHSSALNLIAKEVKRGLLPYPWSSFCDGCPQTGSHSFSGIAPTATVHVLSAPDPTQSEGRLAMLLRTTRTKELERRFAGERRRSIQPGRSRRNLTRADKERLANNLRPTTIFDVFWRLRMKAHYDDADTFVLGAADELDARRFGNAMCMLTDATVAVLEALICTYVGRDQLAPLALQYRERTNAPPDSPVSLRAEAFARQTAPSSPF